MSIITAANESPSARAELPPISFRRWPVRDEPRVAATFAAMAAMVVAATLSVTHDGALATLAFAALSIVCWRSLLPVGYTLSSTAVEQAIVHLWKRRIPWAAVLRCEIWPDGARLFRRGGAHSLDVLQSIFIPWGDQREAILARLKRRALRAPLVDASGRLIVASTIHDAGAVPPISPVATMKATGSSAAGHVVVADGSDRTRRSTPVTREPQSDS